MCKDVSEPKSCSGSIREVKLSELTDLLIEAADKKSFNDITASDLHYVRHIAKKAGSILDKFGDMVEDLQSILWSAGTIKSNMHPEQIKAENAELYKKSLREQIARDQETLANLEKDNPTHE